MPFTAAELADIQNSTLEHYMHKKKVFAQNIQSKPMLSAFDSAAGTFPGGKDQVSFAVSSGKGGGSLQGYTHDDAVSYYNPTGTKRVAFPWKEMHIGTGCTHTELKIDGITVVEDGASQSLSDKDGREEQALADLLDQKNTKMAEDYAISMDSLIHGDGTSDTKAIAGIGAFILQAPNAGSTGGLNRTTNSWWRNWARTTANGATDIVSSPTNGGALLQALQKDLRQVSRYAVGGTRWKFFAGSDFIDAMEIELRANGNYSDTGFTSEGSVDGAMADVKFKGKRIEYDPSLDDLSMAKFMYVIDMRRIKLLYMQGEKMKKSSPARPYDQIGRASCRERV